MTQRRHLTDNEWAALLAQDVLGREPDELLLEVSSLIDRYFRIDLGAAGIDNSNGALVFHSLHHTTATRLDRLQDAPPKERQDAMRHSSPKLTAGYTHTEEERMQALVEGLDAQAS